MLLAAAAGGVSVLAFAPFDFAYLPVVTLAVLFTLWHRASPREALRTGFAFGLGLFGAGTPWLYIALHTFGGMNAALAALGVTGFCCYLALYPGFAGLLATRWTAAGGVPRLLACASTWPLLEWVRSWPIVDFPWLSIGYASLLPHGASWLAGFAPLGGVWLVSLAYASLATVLAGLVHALSIARWRPAIAGLVPGLLVIGGAALLQRVEWTHPEGSTLTISLVQGNVGQDVKFDPAQRDATFALYRELARASRGRVVVLPESAMPAFADEIPASVWREFLQVATERDGLLLTGLFTIEPPEPGAHGLRYYNSVVGLGAAEPQLYRKRHLVPFGESIPLEPIVGWFIRDVLSIPLANQSRGAVEQAAFGIAGQRIAVDICYEDVFGSDIRQQARTATILVNVTNDAWYGRSVAAEQHNQIAAMRALEAGRPLLRATNTGITSHIAPDGRVIARLPWFAVGTLEASVQGYSGATPFVRWGDAVAIVCAAMLLALAIVVERLRALRQRRNDVPAQHAR
ncbi:MAG: apolipoprotein N-acyltransferase [Pseudomonadota bacterium]|nr:apolipoprotein N-acyltransferase [Pseudomonadota bacterium]